MSGHTVRKTQRCHSHTGQSPESICQSDLHVSLTWYSWPPAWDHPSCPPSSLGFQTCQEVLNHVSIFTGHGHYHCPCVPTMFQGYLDFYMPKHSPYQSPSRPGLCVSSYSLSNKAVSLSLCDYRKESSDLTPELDCPLCLPSGVLAKSSASFSLF